MTIIYAADSKNKTRLSRSNQRNPLSESSTLVALTQSIRGHVMRFEGTTWAASLRHDHERTLKNVYLHILLKFDRISLSPALLLGRL